MYQDWIEHKWTLEQIEAIRWRYDNLIYENIADQIGVAYQNVQKRLKAADWDLFKNGMQFIERILKNT
jgi:hypothetical protein